MTLRHVAQWWRGVENSRFAKSWFGQHFTSLIIIGAMVAVASSYIAVTDNFKPLGRTPGTVTILLMVTLFFFLVLAGIVARRVMTLWGALRQGTVGSKLQKRIILTFSLVTILPAAGVAVFSTMFFNLGVQAWFDERVSTAVEESLAVAEAYVAEHSENIRGDVLAMASDLNREVIASKTNPGAFNQIVSAQTTLRSLTEAVVFRREGIIAQSKLSFALAFERLPMEAIQRANAGEVVIITSDSDKVRALVRLDAPEDTYLLVGRLIDNRVIEHMNKTQGAVTEYARLHDKLGHMQTTFSFVYVVLTLLLLLVAVWYGMLFAGRLVAPLSRLVGAAERMRAGDFAVRVEMGEANDEMGSLQRAFNRMAEQLEAQRNELIEANRRLDERRRFSEAVLAGVSAGVVALDEHKTITLYNRTAEALLKRKAEDALTGIKLSDILPGIAEALNKADVNRGEIMQENITLPRHGRMLTLHFRIAVESVGERTEGYIVTFDDITMLVAAQRSAAWSDVARRVAHEIKNPLTPIQLAAERLKRKYAKYIEETEVDTFNKYTDTIARHVGDIGRMVEEFVSFARMPVPVFQLEDLGSLVKKTVFSQQCAHPDIAYHFTAPEQPVILSCDERQINQVLINLLKNAAEAIEGRVAEGVKPAIYLEIFQQPHSLMLEIRDNGPGFPPELIDKLMEPYVTTRSKGSGLGLAIVNKIMEDHKGRIEIANHELGGACVRLFFSRNSDINVAPEMIRDQKS